MQPEKQGFFKDTQQLAEEYVRERLLLMKLEAAEKSARIASIIFTGIVVGTLLMIVLLLLTALACYSLHEVLGSWVYAIGIVSIFYIIIMILLFALRKSFFYKYISNVVVRLFFENSESHEG